MTRFVAVALTALGLLAVLTGCGAQDQPVRSTPSSAASGDPLPPRPREIRMDGLDPCSLATPEALRQAGVGGSPRAVQAPTPGTRICSWARYADQRPSGQLGVFVVTDQDTRNVLSTPGAEVTSVDGFGAVDVSDDAYGRQFNCGVRVDVAPNQGLWVTYLNTLGDEPGATHELMCQRAHTAAETIMRDLLARTK